MQRYRIYTTESEPGYILCEHKDGDVVKAADAEAALAAKDAEIARLRKALEKIAEGISEHEYLVMMAREALEEKK